MGLPYMPFYVNDYLGDNLVSALSAGAQGCYIRILCYLWNGSEPYLPNNPAKLARIVGFPVEEFMGYWEEIQAEGFEILTVSEDGTKITQKRLLAEWEKAQGKCQKLQRAAQARWDKHKQENASAMQMHSKSTSKSTSNLNDNQNQNQIKDNTSSLNPSPSLGLELPEEEEEDGGAFSAREYLDLWNQVMPSRGFSRANKLTDSRRKHFKARQKSFPAATTEQFWQKILFVIYSSDFLSGRNNNRWKADIDFPIRNDDTLTRIIEGKYDNKRSGADAMEFEDEEVF